MSLFSFMRDVGRTLDETRIGAAEAPAAAVPGGHHAPGPAALQAELARLHLATDGIHLATRGDTVIVTGKPRDGETRERIVLALGNLRGVAQVDDQMTASSAAGNLFNAVAAFSHLPAGSASTEATETSLHAAQPELHVMQGSGGSIFYTVHAGDTLQSIAQRHYHDSNAAHRILEANRPMLGAADQLYPGLVLRLPLGH